MGPDLQHLFAVHTFEFNDDIFSQIFAAFAAVIPDNIQVNHKIIICVSYWEGTTYMGCTNDFSSLN